MIRKPDQPVLAIITSHWLSVIGAGIVTTAAICWMLALPAQVRGHVSNPYIGILLFVVLPIVFVAGLVLIPVGLYLARRRVRAGLADTVVDRPTSIRRLATFLAVTTLFNYHHRLTVNAQGRGAQGHRPVLRRKLPCDEAATYGLSERYSFASALC